MSTEAEKDELARLKRAEYERLPHRKEKNRLYAIKVNKQKKMVTTARRFEEFSVEDLLVICAMRCKETNVDFGLYEDAFLTVMTVLHGPQNVQSGPGHT